MKDEHVERVPGGGPFFCLVRDTEHSASYTSPTRKRWTPRTTQAQRVSPVCLHKQFVAGLTVFAGTFRLPGLDTVGAESGKMAEETTRSPAGDCDDQDRSPDSTVRYSPCGRFLAAAGRDATIRFWKLADPHS